MYDISSHLYNPGEENLRRFGDALVPGTVDAMQQPTFQSWTENHRHG
jgi:hypothetical protein